MTKKELHTYLDNTKIDYYTMLRVSTEFIKSEPYRSRLLNHILEESKKKVNFTSTDILLWYLGFVKEDFIHTKFFIAYGSHIQILKAIWSSSNLYNDTILILRSGKPLQVITQVNDKGEEKLAEEVKLTDGQLWNIKMKEARLRKKEAQDREEAEKKRAQEAVKKEEVPHKPARPTVNLNGVKREMTQEELDIIKRLKEPR